MTLIDFKKAFDLFKLLSQLLIIVFIIWLYDSLSMSFLAKRSMIVKLKDEFRKIDGVF